MIFGSIEIPPRLTYHTLFDAPAPLLPGLWRRPRKLRPMAVPPATLKRRRKQKAQRKARLITKRAGR